MKNNWHVKRLDEVATVTMGQSPASSSYNIQGAGVPFLQGMPPVIDSMGTAVPKQWTTEPTRVVEAGTALMTVRAPVGELFTTNASVCLGRGLAGIKANEDISQTYLNYYLQFSKNQLNTLSQGSTFTAINSGDLKGIRVNLPSFKQQEYIGNVLHTIDQAISKTYQIIQKTEVLKQEMMQKLLTKGIGHKRFKNTKLGNVPDSWKVVPLIKLAELQRGYDLPSSSRTQGKFPLVSSNGITDSHNEYKVRNPGVVTGRSGTIGKVFYIDKPFWPLNTTLYVKNFFGNDPKFVYYSLINFGLADYLTGTGVPTLNRNVVHSFPVVLPQINEQKMIAEILSSIDLKISTDRTNKEKLLVLKKGLMQDIFSQKVQIN